MESVQIDRHNPLPIPTNFAGKLSGILGGGKRLKYVLKNNAIYVFICFMIRKSNIAFDSTCEIFGIATRVGIGLEDIEGCGTGLG